MGKNSEHFKMKMFFEKRKSYSIENKYWKI